MIKVWGRMNSINVQKVVWTINELNLLYERFEAGMEHGVVDTSAYRAMNPNGLVPCIEDDGLVLWESNAIVRYLAAKHAHGREPLWPADPTRRALSDRWMDWQATMLYPAMHAAFVGLVRTAPEHRDIDAINQSIALFETKMAILDAQLANHEFLGGADFTMGDIPCGCVVHRWLHMPSQRQSWPNVERWYRSISARPAARAALILPIT